VSRCLILRGIADRTTVVSGGCFSHPLRPCFVPDLPRVRGTVALQLSSVQRQRAASLLALSR
jgi:hypothetical protein